MRPAQPQHNDLSLFDASDSSQGFRLASGLVTVASSLCHLGDGAEPRASALKRLKA